LEELAKRYGDPEEIPPAPQMPDWCFEDAELEDRDDAEEAIRLSNAESVSGDSKKPFIPDFDIVGVAICKGRLIFQSNLYLLLSLSASHNSRCPRKMFQMDWV